MHKALQERRKKTDETYHEYCYRMLEIAARANVEISAVIQYIIDGVDDDETNKIILYDAKSISELKRKFETYEAMKAKSKSRAKADDRKKKDASVDKSDNKGVSKYKKNATDKRCFNCGEKNHLSVECPSKGKGSKCFKCSEYGHIATKCPRTSKAKDTDKMCNTTQGGSKKCYKDVKINGCEQSILFDTGSDISLIRADFYVKIGAPALKNRQIKFKGVGSSENMMLGETQANIEIDGELFEISLYVVPDAVITDAALIGMDFLHNVEMRVKEGSVKIFKLEEKHVELPDVNLIDLADEKDAVNLSHITDQELKSEIKEIISDYQPGQVKDVGVKLNIVLKDEIPVYQRARRLAVSEQEEVDKQIRK